jgi:hypothetical protein
MLSNCSNDPVVCIDFAILFVGEFLKDWTVLATMFLLLALLLKLKADKQRARNNLYARQMEVYDDKRTLQQTRVSRWEAKDGQLIDRNGQT